MSDFAGVRPLFKILPSSTVPRRNLNGISNLEANSNLFFCGLLVALSYYLGVLVGLALTPPEKAISAFWPPNAILLAWFLIVPKRRWWLLLLAVLPAHLLAQLPRGVPIATSLGWFAGNTGEGLLGAYLITQFQNVHDLFERVRGLLIFLAFGFLAAPLLTSFVDASVVISTGMGQQDFWYVWTTRLLSNTLAELTVVPTIVLFYIHGRDWVLKARWARYLEALLFALIIVTAAIYAFAPALSESRKDYSFYMLLLLLAWATLRFQIAGLSLTLLAVSLISSWAVVHGHAKSFATPDNVIPLQLFLFMVTLPSMLISVVLVQQQETANSLRVSKAQLVNSQEQERSRIARELHDGIGQLVSVAEITVVQMQKQCEPGMSSELEDLKWQLGEIARANHEVSHALHPSALQYLGLSVAVRRLCTELMKEHKIVVDFQEAEVPENLSPNVSLAFYRIAQEALHNAAKYSRAQRVNVSLRAKSSRLLLEIHDNGIGFIVKDMAPAGMGLLNMRERMESIGGTLTIKSAPSRGTRVHASFPLCNAA